MRLILFRIRERPKSYVHHEKKKKPAAVDRLLALRLGLEPRTL